MLIEIVMAALVVAAALYALVKFLSNRSTFTLAVAKAHGDEEGALTTQFAVLAAIGAAISLVLGALLWQQVRNTACSIDTNFTASSGGSTSTVGGTADDC